MLCPDEAVDVSASCTPARASNVLEWVSMANDSVPEDMMKGRRRGLVTKLYNELWECRVYVIVGTW